MSTTITAIEVEEEKGIIHNQRATSVGVECADELDNRIPTDLYNITKILDDMILGEYVDNNKDDQGFTESEGGILLKEEETDNLNLFETVKVTMVGRNVNEIKVGDIIVVSKSSGLRIAEFDGKELLMIREQGVFMVVEKK